MRGVKSEATKRRASLGVEPCPAVAPQLSAKRKSAAYKSHVKRGLTHPEAVPALVRQAEAAAVEQRLDEAKMQFLLKKQASGESTLEEARGFLRSISSPMARRLGRIALGEEKDFAPREQIQAMKLVADIAGLVNNEPGRNDDAPLTQQYVAALRQVINQGEERIRQLQEAIRARDASAIEGDCLD